MNTIKSIIFDLGGVILNINYELTSKHFENLGGFQFDTIYNQAKQMEIFNLLETGKISPAVFRLKLKKLMHLTVSDEKFDTSWNAMLLDLPIKRLELIKSLKFTYNTFLLSNTNEIHIKAFKKIINQKIGYSNFTSCFDKCYLSSEIGLRKPNIDCFNYVLKKNNLLPEQTLFIDDSIQHIEGAQKAGLKTYHLKKEEDLVISFPDIIQSTRH
jgi:putative hydrolase of the HAD superfamily